MPGWLSDCVSTFPNNYNLAVIQNLEAPMNYYLLDVEADKPKKRLLTFWSHSASHGEVIFFMTRLALYNQHNSTEFSRANIIYPNLKCNSPFLA